MPLRILHSVHSVDPASGGPIEWIKQVSEHNRREGHSVEIVCLDAPDSPAVLACPVRCHALGKAGGSGYGYTPVLVPWLRTHRANYDIVVINGLWQYSSWGVWRALRGTATPYVVFPHGMLDPWFKRTYPFKHLKKWLYWPWADYRVLRDAAVVVFTGEEERRLARHSFWLYRCREAVASLGIAGAPPGWTDAQARFAAAFPALAGKRLLVYLGRLQEKKGPDLAITAFARLRQNHPDAADDAHLVMVGAADPSYREALAALAARQGAAEAVTWTGLLTGELKWGALAGADAFILPSHQENFGLAVAEAISCGVPVLVSNRVGIWPEVAAAGAGWVAPDDLAGTAESVEQWWNAGPAERADLRLRARRCFAKHFRIETASARFIGLLESARNPVPPSER